MQCFLTAWLPEYCPRNTTQITKYRHATIFCSTYHLIFPLYKSLALFLPSVPSSFLPVVSLSPSQLSYLPFPFTTLPVLASSHPSSLSTPRHHHHHQQLLTKTTLPACLNLFSTLLRIIDLHEETSIKPDDNCVCLGGGQQATWPHLRLQ